MLQKKDLALRSLLGVGLVLLLVWMTMSRPPATETANPDRIELQEPLPPVSWADEGVIDIHGHIGSYGNFDLSEEALLRTMDRAGVPMVLVSNVDGARSRQTLNLHETEANQAMLEVVQRHPKRLRGLLWCRPTDGSADKIEAFLRQDARLPDGSPAWVGLKLNPAMDSFVVDRPGVDPYLDLCGKYDLPVVIHTGRPDSGSSSARVYAIARRHPGVKVILYHMGDETDSSEAIAVAAEALARSDADLYLETAHAQPASVLRAVRELGADRVLFGTDVPWPGGDSQYERYQKMAGLLKRGLSPEEFHLVMSGNAQRLFKLRPPEAPRPSTRPATGPSIGGAS